MANTYTQLHIQLVFAVHGRANLIRESWREELQRYICGVLKEHGCKPLSIYANPDHVHVFFGLHPDVSVAKAANLVKANSSRWLNQQPAFGDRLRGRAAMALSAIPSHRCRGCAGI